MTLGALPLEAVNVTKHFGREGPALWQRLARRSNGHKSSKHLVRAVDGVSFHIRKGEIYGVLGANGSGKSTLIRIISTLLLPDAGSVSIFGMDVVRQSMEVRRLINRVSADPSFFRNMSAAENLLFFGRVYGLSPHEVREQAPAILKRLGLSRDKARETMTNLSRGQQQKVAVARAFLTSPVLLLLDEPTTGLDPRSKRDVQAFIREVQAEHDATILLTTHDMEEAEILCDRISFIAGGKLVAEGTPVELRERVAQQRGLDLHQVSMETVFMEITGRSIEEDEEEDEAESEVRGSRSEVEDTEAIGAG